MCDYISNHSVLSKLVLIPKHGMRKLAVTSKTEKEQEDRNLKVKNRENFEDHTSIYPKTYFMFPFLKFNTKNCRRFLFTYL